MNPRHIQDKCHAGFPRKDSGFSLVELMIALVISLILTAGVIQVYLSSKSAYSTNQALASVQENGRFGLNFLTRDIRMADFWGCFKQQSNNVSNHVNNTNAPAGRDFDFNNALSGTDGPSASNDYSDEITIKRADANGITVVSPYMPNPSADLKVSAPNDLYVDQIVLVSDCSSADIFQITNSNVSHTSVVHNSGTGTPGNATKPLSKSYQGNAKIYSLSYVRYYIGTGTSGEPALFKQDYVNLDGTQELVDGVESMQILYGEDKSNDGVANRYVPAGTSGLNMNNVVSVRLGLLIRSANHLRPDKDTSTYTVLDKTLGPFNDYRLRKVFTTTIGIRNRMQ